MMKLPAAGDYAIDTGRSGNAVVNDEFGYRLIKHGKYGILVQVRLTEQSWS